jgi:hypothetical protein|uniref:Uncharacterized protein n=1 Tax=Fagus sylvatica TaxID=28930 RepID=A0A2N9HQ84_FAGSY
MHKVREGKGWYHTWKHKDIDLASNGYDISSHDGKCGSRNLDLASNDHDLLSHGGEDE